MKHTADMEQELIRLRREEARFLRKHREKWVNPLEKRLADKVPERLEETLTAAFTKAFALVFSKGTAVIEKTYDLHGLAEQYLLDEYALNERGESRDLRRVSRRAERTGALHTLLSGAAGLGMGFLGVGLADIPVFTALLLRNVYEIGMRYGYDYTTPEERAFILRLIAAALSDGEGLQRRDTAIDAFLLHGAYPTERTEKQLTEEAAQALADALLVMKFVQGVPVVGVLGGVSDALTMDRVSEYAELKYRRRFLTCRR